MPARSSPAVPSGDPGAGDGGAAILGSVGADGAGVRHTVLPRGRSDGPLHLEVSMVSFTSGFTGRRRTDDHSVPPGQHVTDGFPVLSAGPTPRVPLDAWELAVDGVGGGERRWSWPQFQALPADDVTVDLHCVTSWSKLGTRWRGVSLDVLLEGVDATATPYAMAHSYGGYTTNVPVADLLGGKAWVAFEFDGQPLRPEHGGPARLLVPHLYLWKSAKWVRALVLSATERPGFWESLGYHLYGDPWKEQRYSRG